MSQYIKLFNNITQNKGAKRRIVITIDDNGHKSKYPRQDDEDHTYCDPYEHEDVNFDKEQELNDEERRREQELIQEERRREQELSQEERRREKELEELNKKNNLEIQRQEIENKKLEEERLLLEKQILDETNKQEEKERQIIERNNRDEERRIKEEARLKALSNELEEEKEREKAIQQKNKEKQELEKSELDTLEKRRRNQDKGTTIKQEKDYESEDEEQNVQVDPALENNDNIPVITLVDDEEEEELWSSNYNSYMHELTEPIRMRFLTKFGDFQANGRHPSLKVKDIFEYCKAPENGMQYFVKKAYKYFNPEALTSSYVSEFTFNLFLIVFELIRMKQPLHVNKISNVLNAFYESRTQAVVFDKTPSATIQPIKIGNAVTPQEVTNWRYIISTHANLVSNIYVTDSYEVIAHTVVEDFDESRKILHDFKRQLNLIDPGDDPKGLKANTIQDFITQINKVIASYKSQINRYIVEFQLRRLIYEIFTNSIKSVPEADDIVRGGDEIVFKYILEKYLSCRVLMNGENKVKLKRNNKIYQNFAHLMIEEDEDPTIPKDENVYILGKTLEYCRVKSKLGRTYNWENVEF